MTLLAAWQALLARYSGQDDVVVGTPIANRTRRGDRGADRLLRQHAGAADDWSGEPTVARAAGRVREVTLLGAYAHQDVPFEQLVETVQPERERSAAAAVPGDVRLAERAARRPRAARLRCSGGGASTTAKFDLTLSLAEMDEGGAHRRRTAEYATALFERETIERGCRALAGVLEAWWPRTRRRSIGWRC